MQLLSGLELSLEHVLQSCVQVSDEICTVPLEKIIYLQSNQNSVTKCLASSMGVCSLMFFYCVGAGFFLKDNNTPGLKTCFDGLWTCAQFAGGPLSEVFSTGSACTYTGSICSAAIAGV